MNGKLMLISLPILVLLFAFTGCQMGEAQIPTELDLSEETSVIGLAPSATISGDLTDPETEDLLFTRL